MGLGLAQRVDQFTGTRSVARLSFTILEALSNVAVASALVANLQRPDSNPHRRSTAVLPDSATLSPAKRELKKLTPAHRATLLEPYLRMARGETLLPRENEPFPVGKGRQLDSTRTALGKTQLRLIYMKVRPKVGNIEENPLQYVGLYAHQKKTEHVPNHIRDAAWRRSEDWLKANLAYERA